MAQKHLNLGQIVWAKGSRLVTLGVLSVACSRIPLCMRAMQQPMSRPLRLSSCRSGTHSSVLGSGGQLTRNPDPAARQCPQRSRRDSYTSAWLLEMFRIFKRAAQTRAELVAPHLCCFVAQSFSLAFSSQVSRWCWPPWGGHPATGHCTGAWKLPSTAERMRSHILASIFARSLMTRSTRCSSTVRMLRKSTALSL